MLRAEIIKKNTQENIKNLAKQLIKQILFATDKNSINSGLIFGRINNCLIELEETGGLHTKRTSKGLIIYKKIYCNEVTSWWKMCPELFCPVYNKEEKCPHHEKFAQMDTIAWAKKP